MPKKIKLIQNCKKKYKNQNQRLNMRERNFNNYSSNLRK